MTTLDLTGEHYQVRYNAGHLEKLIRGAISGAAGRSYKVSPVSAAVLETPFVAGLRSALDGRLRLETTGSMKRGEIRAQTMADRGFSLRVFSRISKVNKSLSIVNQTGGTPVVWFQSQKKMYRYLPNKHAAIDHLVALVEEMGGDMVDLGEAGKTPVDIGVAGSRISDLATIILELAD